MKIAAVRAHVLRDPRAGDHRFEGSYQNVLVEVESDTGLVGIGESDAPPALVKAAIEMPDYNHLSRGLAGVLIGQTLDDPSRLWDDMFEATQWHGRHGTVIHAMSALDIALWDLFAQGLGAPVWACLGEKHHDRLPAYATIYPLAETQEGIEIQTKAFLSQGFRRLKICVAPWWNNRDLLERNLRFLRAVIGPEISLMLDVALEWTTLDQLCPILPLLEELDFKWIEAPFPLNDLNSHVSLRQLTRIPVGIGDLGLTTCREFERYLAADAFDIAQPDLTMFGGLTEARRLGQMLEAKGARIVPHGYNTSITVATNLQFLATRREASLVEYSTSSSVLRQKLATGLTPLDKDGMMEVPTGAGLGVSIDPTVFQRVRQDI
ncbi:MAG: mandelate racemase/muconate lactonizing enzyme family protein [Pseudomonadota bacterium]